MFTGCSLLRLHCSSGCMKTLLKTCLIVYRFLSFIKIFSCRYFVLGYRRQYGQELQMPRRFRFVHGPGVLENHAEDGESCLRTTPKVR